MAVAGALGVASTALAQDRDIELLTIGSAGGNDAVTEFDAVAASADGRVVAFRTVERLVSSDTDDQPDVYVRRGGVTTLASYGPVGGNGAYAARSPVVSRDGSKVYFVTAERLVHEDDDAPAVDIDDVYAYADGAVSLVSDGAASDQPAGLPSRLPVPTGERVVFETASALLGEDTDGVTDLYARTNGSLKLLTPGGSQPVVALDADPSLTYVYFATADALIGSSDQDAGEDTYLSIDGADIRHISRTADPAYAGPRVWVDRVSGDGGRTLVITASALDPADGDGFLDAYVVDSFGNATWVSKPAPGQPACVASPCEAHAYGAAADLSRVAFTTPERLTPNDGDDAVDVYAWSAPSGLELVSGGGAAVDVPQHPGGRTGKVSSDGRAIMWTTSEALLPEDKDAVTDLYEKVDGAVRLVSVGEVGDGGGVLDGTGTYRGARAFFETSTAFVKADVDATKDVYERVDGTTSLVSPGRDAYDADWIGANEDGTRVWLRTREVLAAEDLDGGRDLYEARPVVRPAPPAPPAADTRAPELSVALSRRTFRAGRRAARIAARRKRTPLGTTITFGLSEEAPRTNFAFARLSRGRVSAGKCRRATRRLRRKKRCTRLVAMPGTMSFVGRAGVNRVRFYGRVGRRTYKPARYVMYVRAYDAAGNASALRSVRFTIRRR